MRAMLGWSFLVLILAETAAFADDPSRPKVGTLEGRIVSLDASQPVEGATVVVTDEEGGPLTASSITDANGWFRYKIPAGNYQILAMFGEMRWIHRGIRVDLDKTTQVPGVLAVDPTEIITVHEKGTKEHRPANVKSRTVKPLLPYNDKMMLENVWEVGWMLLDVSETGEVTGFRFLHRPGHDLEKIAEEEVWKLRFDPARDDAGNAMASKVLWKFEWPPYHWVKDHKLMGIGAEGALTPANHERAMADAASDGQLASWEVAAAKPKKTFVLPDGDHKPACRGNAPLNLDSHERVYRDCTPPDLEKINTEPLIPRPK